MGRTDVSIPFAVNDLVFAVDRQFINYTCICSLCGGNGAIDSRQKSTIRGEHPRPPSVVDWDDIEEDEEYYRHLGELDSDLDFEDDGECPVCDGFGSADEDHTIFFPNEIGRIRHIDFQTGVTKGDEGLLEHYEETNITVHSLTQAAILEVDELSKTHQMARFYARMVSGEEIDFSMVDRNSAITTEEEYIFCTYRTACKTSLIHNRSVYKMISDDLACSEESGADFVVTEADRSALVHAIQVIEYVEACIKVVFPDLIAELATNKRFSTNKNTGKPQSEDNTKITEKIEKPETQKSCEALVALGSVIVEEELL